MATWKIFHILTQNTYNVLDTKMIQQDSSLRNDLG